MTLKEKAKDYSEEVIDEVTKSKTKEATQTALSESFLAGFNHAILVCQQDGSRSGFDMAYCLEDYRDEK
jgi:hypothetical protein